MNDPEQSDNEADQLHCRPVLLTPNEVAGRLRVTAEQVRSLIRNGELAAINVGTGLKRPLYRITPQALQQFLGRRWQAGPAVRTKRGATQRQSVPDLFSGLQ
jgi:excisionase family DNA binding protein